MKCGASASEARSGREFDRHAAVEFLTEEPRHGGGSLGRSREAKARSNSDTVWRTSCILFALQARIGIQWIV